MEPQVSLLSLQQPVFFLLLYYYYSMSHKRWQGKLRSSIPSSLACLLAPLLSSWLLSHSIYLPMLLLFLPLFHIKKQFWQHSYFPFIPFQPLCPSFSCFPFPFIMFVSYCHFCWYILEMTRGNLVFSPCPSKGMLTFLQV